MHFLYMLSLDPEPVNIPPWTPPRGRAPRLEPGNIESGNIESGNIRSPQAVLMARRGPRRLEKEGSR